jgi:hypothetical protein
MAYHTVPIPSYLAPKIKGTTIIETWETTTYVPSKKHLLFIFIPERQSELDTVMKNYPDGRLFEEYNKNTLLYWGYEVADGTQ